MIASINQPAYLPWLGYFHRVAISDLHIVLDDVQFEKNSFSNRNKVRTRDGWCWLTVPVKSKGKFGDLALNRIEIDANQNWAAKHWATLRQSYARAAHFAAHQPALEAFYGRTWERLADLTREMTAYQLDAFGIRTPLKFSSELEVEGAKDELVLNLCKSVGATTYISGPLGRNYLRPEIFEEAGIAVVYHDYQHPTYTQAHPGFEPGMAALDLLLNEGPASLATLKSGNAGFESLAASDRPNPEGTPA
jgi:hypothetical protein